MISAVGMALDLKAARSGRWQGCICLCLNCVSKVSSTTLRIIMFSKRKTLKGQELYNAHDLPEISVDF